MYKTLLLYFLISIIDAFPKELIPEKNTAKEFIIPITGCPNINDATALQQKRLHPTIDDDQLAIKHNEEIIPAIIGKKFKLLLT